MSDPSVPEWLISAVLGVSAGCLYHDALFDAQVQVGGPDLIRTLPLEFHILDSTVQCLVAALNSSKNENKNETSFM